MEGIVIKSTGSFYVVRIGGVGEAICSIRGKLRLKGFRTTNPVTVGDIVDVDMENEAKGDFVITHIHERKNYLIRKSTNLSKESHILAANIDQVLVLVTLSQPETSTVFIDRFLVTAEAYNITAILCFNKIDLYSDEELTALKSLKRSYQKAGYDCYEISVTENRNLNELSCVLKDKTTVLAGLSGVGKSSLINKLEPTLNLKTDDISEAHNTGKHTTTFAEMFPLHGGGYIIDTPGIRSFGLIDMKKEELSHYFPEIFKASEDCRFYNCTHIHEPGCAVLKAVKEGGISESRYLSYCSLMEDEGGKYR
ncbi:putative ribosome biogenesis GTPase RsgA [Bacteroidia bacterium]|nr:putative ribosome biogenesis GTPase RsgA [Bacteroidia bacterium]